MNWLALLHLMVWVAGQWTACQWTRDFLEHANIVTKKSLFWRLVPFVIYWNGFAGPTSRLQYFFGAKFHTILFLIWLPVLRRSSCSTETCEFFCHGICSSPRIRLALNWNQTQGFGGLRNYQWLSKGNHPETSLVSLSWHLGDSCQQHQILQLTDLRRAFWFV